MSTKPRCPVCKAPVTVPRTSPVYPFCSKRCQQIDLGNWLNDSYAISEDIVDTEGIETEAYREEEAGG